MIVIVGNAIRAKAMGASLARLGEPVEIPESLNLDDMREVRRAILEHKPRAVLHVGGVEDIEACERDPDACFRANAENVIHIAAAALEAGAQAVMISSAEVFGRRGGPWMEADEVSPMSAYARSKIQGEKFLLRAMKDALVVRVGPLVSVAMEEERFRLRKGVVEEADDELVSPISADDLASAVKGLVDKGASGVFHLASDEEGVSRADLWRAIAGALGYPEDRVLAKRGRLLSRKGTFGARTALLGKKAEAALGAPIPGWRSVLETVEKDAPPVEEPTAMDQPSGVRRVDKPWGHEIIWAETERYVGKLLFIKQGERLSLQYHEKKDETVYVLSGKMLFEVGPKDGEREDIIMKPGDRFHITPFTVHRMIAIEDTQILEASTPELDDVVRLEDKYGRQGTNKP